MNNFLPAIFGETLLPQEKGLFSLPIREGGLGIEELLIKAPRVRNGHPKRSPNPSNSDGCTK